MAGPAEKPGLRLVVLTPGGRLIQPVPDDPEAWAAMVDGLNEILPEGSTWRYEKDTAT